jgi:hypothetical protein
MKRVDGIWYIANQQKIADPSFDLTIGSVSDVMNRLAERITKLENR